MKAVFIYDHRFLVKADKVYSSGAFTSESWERYLDHFDELTVVGFKENHQHLLPIKYNVCNHPKVNFRFLQPLVSFSSYLNSLFYNITELVEIIKAHDAIIIRMPGLMSANAVKVSIKLNKPFAIEAVGCPWDSYWNYGKLQARALAPIAYWQMKKWIGKSPLVLYVTERFLQNRYPSHGYVTHASNVMLDISEPDILEKRLLRIKNITSERLMLGTVGKIDFKTKGHHIAIQALKEFKKKGGDFTWKVVGPGENSYLQSLAKRAGLEDHIQIVGKLTAGKQMMEFYDNIDLLIHPSLQEGLPRSIIEAMSRACPVLASSIAGTPELLPSKYLHKPGRYTELFLQLIQLTDNIECLQKMARENLEKSKEFQKQKLQKRRFEFIKNLEDCQKRIKYNKNNVNE